MSLITLHSDVLRNIFIYLEPRDLALARFVCSRFRGLISLPTDIKYIRYDKDLHPVIDYTNRVVANLYVDNTKLFYWARQNKCPLGYGIITAAVFHNNRDVMKYIHENHPEITRRSVDVHKCAFYGHLELLQWMVAIGYASFGFMGHAAAGNHRDILEWGLSQGQSLDRYVCAGTMISGSIEILEWTLKMNDKKISDMVRLYELITLSSTAATYGHIQMLEWLHQHNCPISNTIMSIAAARGDIKMLQWVKNRGYNEDPYAYVEAVKHQHIDLEVLRWLIANDIPFSINFLDEISQNASPEALQIIHRYISHLDSN